jgi:hypothetical protein
MSYARISHPAFFSTLTTPKSKATLPVNPDYISQFKANVDRGIFPQHFRLPFELTQVEYFFDHKKIVNSHRPYGIGRSQAVREYQEFLKQYYYAYVTYLEAINGDAVALQKFKQNFASMELFGAAGVSTEYLNENVKHKYFRPALLAYLFLEIFYSRDLSATARLRAIDCLNHFIGPTNNKTADKKEVEHAHGDKIEISAIKAFLEYSKKELDPKAEFVEAFLRYIKGYELGTVDAEPAFDLLPVDFFPEEADAAVTPHNEEFMANVNIKRFFPLADNKTLDTTLNELITDCPREAAQILKSLLRLNPFSQTNKLDKGAILLKIISLSNIPLAEHEKVLGREASFMPRETNPYVLQRFAKTQGIVQVDVKLTETIAHMSTLDIKKMALMFFSQPRETGKPDDNDHAHVWESESLDKTYSNGHQILPGLRNGN